MYIKKFTAEQYRNIESCDLAFSPGVNLLCGKNAQGKTNVIEGIYTFARGKSFRAGTETELVKFGENGYHLSVTFEDREREQTLSYRFAGGVRTRMRNGGKVRALSEYLGVFRAVLFCPEHLMLIKGGPSERREFLNIAVSQCHPLYLSQYREYGKVLENRNCLLRSASKGGYFDYDECLAWSEKMAQSAADIHMRRLSYLDGIQPYAETFLHDISGGRETLSIRYVSENPETTREGVYAWYRQALTSHIDRECQAGCSLYGVHRDDMECLLDGVSARMYASQGQQRSIVLALKLAEGEYARSVTGEYPVFLFDDVLSELDEGRRAYVLSRHGERQMVLTSCERSETYVDRIITVEGGRYVPSYRCREDGPSE